MWLFCNFSANIHRKRRGAEGGRCECLLSLYSVQAFSVLKGRLPHPKPMAHSAAEGPKSHGHQVAEMGILSQVNRTSKAAFFPQSYTSQEFKGFN